MVDQRLNDLVRQLERGRLDRRAFVRRAAGLGVSMTAIGAALGHIGLAQA